MISFAESWLRPRVALAPGVHALATTRLGGVSSAPYDSFNLAVHCGDDAAAVAENRTLLSQALPVTQVQWLQQVHGAAVHHVTASVTNPAPCADAMWTQQAGVALAILTADCVPILLAEQQGQCIGAAHAGWQGLDQGVIAQVIEAMPVRANRLTAWIGPCISQGCYEVGEDVWGRFDAAYHGVHDNAAKRFLDLSAIAAAQLRALGVVTVQQADACTWCDSRLYSYRQARQAGLADTGRMASLIMRAGQPA